MNPQTLRDRLRHVVSGGRAQEAPTLVPREIRASGALEEALGGEWREDDTGRSFVVRRRYSPAMPYGRHRVGDFGDALSGAAQAAALLGPAGAQGPFVFFDLETSGLSGGAGTYAFIVGCGWFDEVGAFITEQHLLVDVAGERAMLRRVAQDLASAGALVTFNGKSFDAPVVETRYLFHRLSSPCAALAHVDMIHPSRRFWSGLMTDGCSLIALERELLGAVREGDVPGFEIPARYFHFVRSGDPRPLVDVLEHNRRDLISLAGLTARLFTLIEDGPETVRHPQEALALGRVYERAGLTDRAEAAFEQAVTRVEARASSSVGISGSDREDSHRDTHVDALRALALAARRQRRYDRAAGWWRQLLEVPYCPAALSREATEALAIHHEHRVRDLAAAKLFALRSLETETGAARGDAVRHRLARIERKLISERRPFPSLPLLPSCDFPTSARRTSS